MFQSESSGGGTHPSHIPFMKTQSHLHPWRCASQISLQHRRCLKEFSELTASSCNTCKIYLNIQSEARQAVSNQWLSTDRITEHTVNIFTQCRMYLLARFVLGFHTGLAKLNQSHTAVWSFLSHSHSSFLPLSFHMSETCIMVWKVSHGYSSSVCPLLFIGLTVNKILTLLNLSLWWFPRGFQMTHMITCKYMGGYMGGWKRKI